MQKKLILIFWMLVCGFSLAYNIEIQVSKHLAGNFVFANFTTSPNVVNVSTEFYNSGSVPYAVRLRLDVDDISVWSKKKILLPGERQFFEMKTFYQKQEAKARLRAYFGNEMLLTNWTDLNIEIHNSTDVFEINDIKTGPDSLEFTISSVVNTHAIIMPLNYPVGWIFEENDIGFIGNASKKRVKMKYYPDVQLKDPISMVMFSNDGLYATQKTINLSYNVSKLETILIRVIFGNYVFHIASI